MERRALIMRAALAAWPGPRPALSRIVLSCRRRRRPALSRFVGAIDRLINALVHSRPAGALGGRRAGASPFRTQSEVALLSLSWPVRLSWRSVHPFNRIAAGSREVASGRFTQARVRQPSHCKFKIPNSIHFDSDRTRSSSCLPKRRRQRNFC